MEELTAAVAAAQTYPLVTAQVICPLSSRAAETALEVIVVSPMA